VLTARVVAAGIFFPARKKATGSFLLRMEEIE
jgi:hypothetical protein